MAGVGGGKRRRNDLETKKRDGIPVSSVDHIQHVCLNAV